MTDVRDALAREEYAALRATIRERGHLRLIVTAVTFLAWAAVLVVAWPKAGDAPMLSLATLLMLSAGFESALSAHAGAERIGRYLAVEYEGTEAAPPRWERTVLAFGARPIGAPLDPLVTPLFLAAAVVNLWPVALQLVMPGAGGVFHRSAVGSGVGLVVLAHVLFGARVLQARGFIGRQRDADTAVIRQDRAAP